jgi:hypothetical protein
VTLEVNPSIKYDDVVGLPRKVRLPADVPAYTRYPGAPLTLFHETAMVVSVWVMDAKPVGAVGNDGPVSFWVGSSHPTTVIPNASAITSIPGKNFLFAIFNSFTLTTKVYIMRLNS